MNHSSKRCFFWLGKKPYSVWHPLWDDFLKYNAYLISTIYYDVIYVHDLKTKSKIKLIGYTPKGPNYLFGMMAWLSWPIMTPPTDGSLVGSWRWVCQIRFYGCLLLGITMIFFCLHLSFWFSFMCRYCIIYIYI